MEPGRSPPMILSYMTTMSKNEVLNPNHVHGHAHTTSTTSTSSNRFVTKQTSNLNQLEYDCGVAPFSNENIDVNSFLA